MHSKRARHVRSPFTADLHTFFFSPSDKPVFHPCTLYSESVEDFEISFCQDILARDPECVDALSLLSEAYSRKGEHQKGLETDLRLSQVRPYNSIVQYNLACSLALNGQKDDAIEALYRAIKLGYCDLEHLLHDQDLSSLSADARYKDILNVLRDVLYEQTQQS